MLKYVCEITELLDNSKINGFAVKDFFLNKGIKDVKVMTIKGQKGSTDFIRIRIAGFSGKSQGGKAPTLGIIGRLGGIGARPERIGIVSDSDGAVCALSCAYKLGEMQKNGDILPGDVIVTTHICPNAPIQPHEPVAFMDSPVDMETMNKYEVDKDMDAILTVDTTKGNKIANWRGVAISPIVKEGFILKISDDLIRIMEWVSGEPVKVLPITMQDITPYGNGVSHLNSIMQPCTVTDSPVAGVAITAVTAVPGCSTGTSREIDIEEASRFCIEVAKEYTTGRLSFYDHNEFQKLVGLYGSMKHLQTLSKNR